MNFFHLKRSTASDGRVIGKDMKKNDRGLF